MAELRIETTYDDSKIPAQRAFRGSKARYRFYGGAMGGGKSFALCQEAFDMMLDYPGILLPIFRSTHTAIAQTTRRTFVEQVLPPELVARKDLVRIVNSQGVDLVEFKWSGSQCHFVGLDDPGRWFSSELGAAMFDEAHEIDESAVITISSRLRQRCRSCVAAGRADCQHMPRSICAAFNPSYPGHWIQRWAISGGVRTEFGYRKDELLVEGANSSLGDLDFFMSRATDNPFLPPNYVEQSLGGMPELQRRRYLDGEWLHLSGASYFDSEALQWATEMAQETQVYLQGEPSGDETGKDKEKPPTINPHKSGRMEVFKPPVRHSSKPNGDEIPAHRYVVAVDASTGASTDYSAIQVIDVEEWEQAAEWQGKVDPDQLARLAFLTACVYNGATIAVEVTGGYGFGANKYVQEMIAKWQGTAKAKPKMYLRPIVDRLSDQFTTKLGWDTNVKSRAHMLTLLEETFRERTIRIYGQRTLAEMGSFAFPEYKGTGDYGKPQARKGTNDDLAMALAIAVAVAERLPRVRYDSATPLVMRYA